MHYQPHEYQSFATNFILEHPVSAVFLDMGLGKTAITLTAIQRLIQDRFEISHVLVIAPLRVAQLTAGIIYTASVLRLPSAHRKRGERPSCRMLRSPSSTGRIWSG